MAGRPERLIRTPVLSMAAGAFVLASFAYALMSSDVIDGLNQAASGMLDGASHFKLAG